MGVRSLIVLALLSISCTKNTARLTDTRGPGLFAWCAQAEMRTGERVEFCAQRSWTCKRAASFARRFGKLEGVRAVGECRRR